MVRTDIIRSAACMALFVASNLAQPVLLREIILMVERHDAAGWPLCLLLSGAVVLGALGKEHHSKIALHAGLRMRAAASAAVFRTALTRRLSDTLVATSALPGADGGKGASAGGAKGKGGAGKEERTGSSHTGKIINLISSDAQKFFDIAPLLNSLWACPLQIVIATLLLVALLGGSAVIGVFTLSLMVPLTRCVSTAMGAVRR